MDYETNIAPPLHTYYNMTEGQLREAIEKELREKYAYELEDLNLGVAQ